MFANFLSLCQFLEKLCARPAADERREGGGQDGATIVEPTCIPNLTNNIAQEGYVIL